MIVHTPTTVGKHTHTVAVLLAWNVECGLDISHLASFALLYICLRLLLL